MNRDAFESRLQQLLDERQAPSNDADLLRAAEQDAELRCLLSAYESVLAATGEQQVPEHSPRMAERVWAELRPAGSHRKVWHAAWLAPTVAVAATLLIATSIVVLSGKRPADETATGNSAPTVAQEPNSPETAPLGRIARSASEQYRHLANSTGDSVSMALSIVPSGGTNEPVALIARPRDQWLRNIPSQLRPLSISTTSSVASLMRAVPAADDKEQGGY